MWSLVTCHLRGWRPQVRLASMRKISDEIIPEIEKRNNQGKATEGDLGQVDDLNRDLREALGIVRDEKEFRFDPLPPPRLQTDVEFMEGLLTRVMAHRVKWEENQK